MWVSKVIFLIYFITGGAAQEEDLPVPCVQLESQWSEVFLSEPVKLRCDLNISNIGNWTIAWYKDEQEVKASDTSVMMEAQSVSLMAASASQSGAYSCRGTSSNNASVSTSPSKTLHITVHGEKLQPELSTGNFSSLFVGESFTFRCSVNALSLWEYVWYQNDNVKHKSSENVYTIDSAEESHNGEYYCRVQREAVTISMDSNIINITVADVPIPRLKLINQWSDVIVNDVVYMSCEAVGPDWIFTWFRDEQPLAHDDTNILFTDRGGARLTIHSASKSLQGRYTCTAQHNTRRVSSGQSQPVSITVHDKPSPTLSKSPALNTMYTGETVNFTCAVSLSSGWTYTWYKDDVDIGHTDPTLSVRLTLSDAGGYSCKGLRGNTTQTLISDKMTQSVDDVPVPVVKLHSSWSEVFVNEAVTLDCETSNTEWRFSWFRNGRPLSGDSSLEITEQGSPLKIVSASKSHAGSYSCKAHHKTRNVHSETSQPHNITVYDVPVPVVKLHSSWSEVFVNEAVTLDCETSNTDWTFSWFRNGQPLSEDSSLEITEQGSPLKIVSASRSHAGSYSCKAHHKTRNVHSETSQPHNITVYENPAKATLSRTLTYNPLYVGEAVTLACRVDVASGWKFRWFKSDKELISSESSVSLQLGLSDAGDYSCTGTRGGRTQTQSSDKISITVVELPLPQVKALTPWLDVFPSETAELGCEVPAAHDWTYEWQKNDQSVSGDRATFTISPASEAQYKCRATQRSRSISTSFSAGLTLKVYDQNPTPVLVQYPDYSTLFPKEPLSLHCHINVSSGWEFVWYQNNKRLQTKQDKHEVASPDVTHSGSYTCQARRGETHSFSTSFSHVKKVEIRKVVPEPVLSQSPDTHQVYRGEPVTFKCIFNISSDWEYLWFKNDQILPISEAYSITTNTTHPPREVYKCKVKRKKTSFETESRPRVIQVSEIPIPSVENLTPWLDVFPTETVMLRCQMETGASDWRYEWSKDGHPIARGDSVKTDQDGRSLTIVSSVSHNGEYSCTAQHKRRDVNSTHSPGRGLQVYDSKPRAQLVQDPEFSIFYTDDSVSYSCGVNTSSGWEYVLYKENREIASGPTHTITQLSGRHSGEYTCTATRGQGERVFHAHHSRGVAIEVKERPSAAVVLLTGWSEVFSTDSLVLKCEAKDSEDKDWEFIWFKGGERMNQSSSERHTITPQSDPDQSLYMCQGVRSTGRPSYTRRSEPLRTNNLLLKRRVLLSVSGCLLCGICAVVLGCIALKVLRKPVVEQEKTEEVDLFLTRAELSKHAPNPLAEYVTDEDFKDIAKEAEKNETMSCDSALLQITSVDEAAPSESNNTTGNGEMVSFKH